MRRLHQAQREQGCSVLVVARKYAHEGMTIRQMAEDLNVNYGSLKRNLTERGHKHPQGIELKRNKFKFSHGIDLIDYIVIGIEEGKSRNMLSEATGLDNKTLQKLAVHYGWDFPKTTKERNYTNIVSAMLARQHLRGDLLKITWKQKTMCLADWSREVGILEATLRKRLKLGWSVSRVLSEKVKYTGGHGRVTWSYRCPVCRTKNHLPIRTRKHMFYDYSKQAGTCSNLENHK